MLLVQINHGDKSTVYASAEAELKMSILFSDTHTHTHAYRGSFKYFSQ